MSTSMATQLEEGGVGRWGFGVPLTKQLELKYYGFTDM
jgi:hypothetical protein